MSSEGDHEEKRKAAVPLTAALHRKHIKQLYEVMSGRSLSRTRAASLRFPVGFFLWGAASRRENLLRFTCSSIERSAAYTGPLLPCT
mmetsp:Transcript_26599/g.103529  ORF Transcript_26599/g.103529 Transcript_26599/m.103529 type:complete len:87 (+) Transcript_26599:117-377(+)